MRAKYIVLLSLLVVVTLAVFNFGESLFAGYENVVRVNDEAMIRGSQGITDSTPKYSTNGSAKAELKPGQVLSSDIAMGSIEVTGTDSTEANLAFTVTVYGDSVPQAQAFADKVSVTLTPYDGGLRLESSYPSISDGIRGVKVAVTGTIPAAARVDISNSYGPVKVTNVSGPSRVTNGYDLTKVDNVRGDWELDADYSGLLVNRVDGNVIVNGSYASTTVGEVTGDLEIYSDFRETDVNNVGGDLVVRGRYGSLSVNGVTGQMRVDGQYMEVDGRNLGDDVSVEAAYGDVTLEDLKKNVSVRTQYAGATLRFGQPLDHRFTIRSDFGDIAAPAGIEVLSQKGSSRKSAEGIIGGGDYTVEVESSYGDVDIR
jgi:hypothetical protein